MKQTLLRIKWGVSRGINSYGYTLCTLYADGKKEVQTNGVGYDMKGTVLATYIKRYYLPRLLKLTGNHGSQDDGKGFYGLMFYDNKVMKWEKKYKEGFAVSLDGACGWSSIMTIANAIGLKIERMEDDIYLLTDNRTTV